MDASKFVIGNTVRFRTQAPHDNVLYTGEVTGLVGYAIAKSFGDMETYNQDVSRATNTELAVTELTFVIISVAESESAYTTKAFALEWIDSASFEEVSVNTYTDYRIFDVDSSSDTAKEILGYLTTLGYTVEKL